MHSAIKNKEYWMNTNTPVCAHTFINFHAILALHIQLRLSGLSNCKTYIESEAIIKVSDITNELSRRVEELCVCGFSSLFISDNFIRCFDSSLDYVTYRALITKTENISVVKIASIITEWVNEDSSIIVQSTGLHLENSCPVVIADRESPECPQDITNRPLMTTASSPTLNIGAVAGVSMVVVFAITLILQAIIVLALKIYCNRLRMNNSQPTNTTRLVCLHIHCTRADTLVLQIFAGTNF